MDLAQDIACIAAQEDRLVFPQFDQATAWELGTRLQQLAMARGVAVTIEIRLQRETVFLHAMPGTTPVNADWARRKRNTVDLLQRSSYAIGLELQRDKTSLEQKMGLATRDHTAAGGCFPLRVAGSGCVGTVTVSGLPQRDDHNLVVEVMAQMCGVPLTEVALA
jgi:uncharacterized protein (UPF0303 family)